MPEPTPIRPGAADRFQKYGLGWRFTTDDGILISVDYLKRRGDELHGQVTIESRRPGEAGHIHEASHNFTSLSARAHLIKHLLGRVPDVNWAEVLEQFCVGVCRRYNQGEPFIKIGRRPRSEARIEWVVEDLVPKGAMTWWYGARGSCKSQTAALMAICLSEGIPFLDSYVPDRLRVGILDWEDHDTTWEMYLQWIARGLDIEPPEIAYRHCTVPIVRQINTLAKLIDGEGLDVLITDSFGGAGGPASEHAGFEEIALNFSAAAKELDRTFVVIDHVSQANRLNPKAPADPIGSQQKLAQARAGYELRMEKEPGAAQAHVGIFDRKHQMVKPMGVLARWDKDAESLTFETEDLLATNTEMVANAVAPIERILFQLKAGRRTVKELAERLTISEKAIAVALRRAEVQERVVELPDGAWGLMARSYVG